MKLKKIKNDEMNFSLRKIIKTNYVTIGNLT